MATLLLLICLAAAWLFLAEGFIPSVLKTATPSKQALLALRQQKLPEYEAIEDDDNEANKLLDELSIHDVPKTTTTTSDDVSFNSRIVALRRGCVVKIVVGTNSRKAWKKRRRSGSPLLVACTIQSIDPVSAIRCNVLHLLRNSRANIHLIESKYRRVFGEPLVYPGFDSTVELLKQVFKNPKYKTNIIQKDEMWYVESYRRRRTEDPPLLQFNDAYLHTGVLANGESVSAALRLSNTEIVPEPGTELFAVVWDFEPEGDAGFPLVTVSLTPPKETIGGAPVQKARAMPVGYRLRGVVTKLVRQGVIVECPSKKNDQGAIRGVLRYRDARFPQDRNEVENKDDDTGFHSFKKGGTIDDLFESDFDEEDDDSDDLDEDEVMALLSESVSADENEEDITDMFTQNDDGSLSFTNPETGLVERIEMLDDDEDEEDEDDENSDEVVPTPKSDKRSFKADNQAPSSVQETKPVKPWYRYVRVNVGDQVDVFVKSHSPKERTLFLTMDPTIKDLPKKERRMLDTVNKRTERLAKRLGGMKAIRKLRGKEVEGIVKATSNMGDRRLYIQPNEDLPVGVASCPDTVLLDEIQQGDSVRVRLDGLDEQRGQLAMIVLERIDRSLPRTESAPVQA